MANVWLPSKIIDYGTAAVVGKLTMTYGLSVLHKLRVTLTINILEHESCSLPGSPFLLDIIKAHRNSPLLMNTCLGRKSGTSELCTFLEDFKVSDVH